MGNSIIIKGAREHNLKNISVEIPKKNGKSEFCAAIGLYMLTNDGEKGAEVYCAAADREQASIVYQAASAMVRNSAGLSRHLKCLDSRKRIIYRKNNSYFQVLSSESYTKHGLNPSCVIVDEIHAHPNDELWNVLTAGTDYARRQQIVLVITTAGIYDKTSIWWRLRSKAIQVGKGIIQDPRFLPVLYLADPEKDNPDDEELWKRVNPSLGQIFTQEVKPYEVGIMLAEVGDTSESTLLFKITYDGTLTTEDDVAAIGGQEEQLTAHLRQSFRPGAPLAEAVQWGVAAFEAASSRKFQPNEWEAAVIDRTLGRRAFRRLSAAEMGGV